MGQMATVPVFACRGCGRPVYATHLSTKNDPDNELLKKMMQGLSKIALCKHCKAQSDYFAQTGRLLPLNNTSVIYSVVDPSGADYYGRGLPQKENEK